MSLKELVKKVAPKPVLSALNRFLTQRRIDRLNRLQPMSLARIKEILTEVLGVKLGDTLFVHASFGDLRADVTSDELVKSLMETVGPTGNILMPFYPMKTSYEALLEGKTFDLRKHRTSMGALAMSFAKMEGVRKSIHPTKSVAVWGKDRDFLISDHHKDVMPYGPASPYSRILKLKSAKIIGLAVRADYLSCMHVAVDFMPDYPIQPYHPNVMEGEVVDYDGRTVQVKTFAHDLAITGRENVPLFLQQTKCPSYREIKLDGRDLFVVEAHALVDHTMAEAKKGNTFFYPRSLNFKQPHRNAVS